MKKILLASVASLLCSASAGFSKAVPLQEAAVTRIVNDVRVFDPKKGTTPARISQVIKNDMGVKTGVKSRAELLFQDKTLTRLGAESYFTFNPGSREMSLDSGTLLLQVPKNHGGATIRAASVTASITGTTVLVENLPNKTAKFLVLEGSMRISLKNKIGESLSLRAGQMLIMPPRAKSIPEPVNVDLRRLIQTSSLVNPKLFSARSQPAELPSRPLIEEAVRQQDKARKEGKLVDTNIAIIGNGTKLATLNQSTLDALDAGGKDQIASAQDGTQVQSSTAAQQTARETLRNTTASTTPSQRKVLSIGSRDNPLASDVTIRDPIDLSPDPADSSGKPSGLGGLFSLFTSKRAKVEAPIQVSSNSTARNSATGGDIRIESLNANASQTGIEINSSGQLLSLLNAAAPGPGGTIELVTAGSRINLQGRLVAERGTIAVISPGTGSEIKIDRAELAADVIKVGAFGPDGTLKIGNSRITADSMLYLYGGSGTGGVEFVENTLLDGAGLKYIAGREVKISSNKVVTIGGGPATIFTDKPSYGTISGGDGSTTGRFQKLGGTATPYAPPVQPYANRP